MKKLLLAVVSFLCLSIGAQADEWKHNYLRSSDGADISVDYKYMSERASIFASPVWLNVLLPAGVHCPTSLRVVFENHYDLVGFHQNTLEKQHIVDLYAASSVGSRCRYTGRLPFVLLSSSQRSYGYNYRQELSLVVNGRWLKDPISNSTTFKLKMRW